MKHKNIQIKPCKVDWFAMEAGTKGNRFCHNCHKVVHDMSHLSEAEADAFLAEHPGSCGNFLASQIDVFEPKVQPTSPIAKFVKGTGLKKAAAAAAAITLLHGNLPADLLPLKINEETTMKASDPTKNTPDPIGPSTNTLLTGVLLTEYGREIHQNITMTVTCGSKLVDYVVHAENGLFMLDLKGMANPSDEVTITIPRQEVHGIQFPETKLKTLVGEGQNLAIRINAIYPKRLGGVMVRPKR